MSCISICKKREKNRTYIGNTKQRSIPLVEPQVNIPKPVRPKRARPILIFTKLLFTVCPLNIRYIWPTGRTYFWFFETNKQTNKQKKPKAYKLDQNLNTKSIKNIYLIKSKNFKINMKRLKMKTKRRKENSNKKVKSKRNVMWLESGSRTNSVWGLKKENLNKPQIVERINSKRQIKKWKAKSIKWKEREKRKENRSVTVLGFFLPGSPWLRAAWWTRAFHIRFYLWLILRPLPH